MKDSIVKLPSNQEKALDTCDQEQRKKEKQRTLNKILIAYLASAFKSHSDLTIIFEIMTDNWPGGIAYKVFDKVKMKYQAMKGITDVNVQ
jgi:hypothetical protein